MSRFPTCEGTTKEGLPCVVAKHHRGPCRKSVNTVGRPVSDGARVMMANIFKERPAPTHLGVYDPEGYKGRDEIRRKYRGFLSAAAR